MNDSHTSNRHQRHAFSATASLLLALFLGQSDAATFTYSLSNYPAFQNNATLAGSITVDTGATPPDAQGNYYLGHSAITAWDFTVTPSESSSYSLSSTGINPSASGFGGSTALYASPTTLSVIAAASLALEADLPNLGDTIGLIWVYDTPIYDAGGDSVGGSTWLSTDRLTLDSTFPSNPDLGVTGNWVIATAVPEPSMTVLLMASAAATLVIAARQRRSRQRAS